MNRSKSSGFLALAILISTLLFASGCLGSTNVPSNGVTPTTTMSKPQPVIEKVNAITSGMENNYFAMLEVTLRNEGPDGTVIISATITQGNQTQTNEMITYINHNTSQMLRLIFPLKWKGGEWTPNVQALVP